MNLEILVNKNNCLSSNFVPSDLIITDDNEHNFHKYKDDSLKPTISKLVYSFFDEMKNDAIKENIYLLIDSGYRSFDYQKLIWESSIKNRGLEETEKWVAKPGCSEHQTGLAIDVAFYRNGVYCDSFDEDDYEIKWLINNSYKYGFILRYPKGKEKITGFNFEPWHYRFVGISLAQILYENNITLEEYYKKIDFTKNK